MAEAFFHAIKLKLEIAIMEVSVLSLLKTMPLERVKVRQSILSSFSAFYRFLSAISVAVDDCFDLYLNYKNMSILEGK